MTAELNIISVNDTFALRHWSLNQTSVKLVEIREVLIAAIAHYQPGIDHKNLHSVAQARKQAIDNEIAARGGIRRPHVRTKPWYVESRPEQCWTLTDYAVPKPEFLRASQEAMQRMNKDKSNAFNDPKTDIDMDLDFKFSSIAEDKKSSGLNKVKEIDDSQEMTASTSPTKPQSSGEFVQPTSIQTTLPVVCPLTTDDDWMKFLELGNTDIAETAIPRRSNILSADQLHRNAESDMSTLPPFSCCIESCETLPNSTLSMLSMQRGPLDLGAESRSTPISLNLVRQDLKFAMQEARAGRCKQLDAIVAALARCGALTAQYHYAKSARMIQKHSIERIVGSRLKDGGREFLLRWDRDPRTEHRPKDTWVIGELLDEVHFLDAEADGRKPPLLDRL